MNKNPVIIFLFFLYSNFPYRVTSKSNFVDWRLFSGPNQRREEARNITAFMPKPSAKYSPTGRMSAMWVALGKPLSDCKLLCAPCTWITRVGEHWIQLLIDVLHCNCNNGFYQKLWNRDA